jgi:archaellum component FlaC
MIGLTRSEELQDLLLWEFVIDPRFCMPDTSKHVPRWKRPKTLQEKVDAMARDLAELKSETERELSRLASSVETLNTAISALATQVETLASKKGFWRKFWVERHWTVPAFLAVIAIALTVIGSIGAGGYSLAGVIIDKHIESKLTPVNARLDNATERLNVLDKGITGINTKLGDLHDLLKMMLSNRIKDAARLSPEQFSRALPDLEQDLSVAKADGVKIPDETLAAIRHKLLSIASTGNAPVLWRAAAAVINYRASSAAPSSMSNCLSIQPTSEIIGVTPKETGGSTLTHGPEVYADCTLQIDTPEAATALSPYLAFANIEFSHCFIRYGGKTIVIPRTAVGKLVFRDCTFLVITGDQPPSPRGRQLLEALLKADDTRSAEIKLPT